MISYDELLAENARLLQIIKALEEENAWLRESFGSPQETSVNITQVQVVARQATSRETIIAERIALYRSLFHGREDVYARRWHNEKTGHSGYKPVCDHENSRGFCTKFDFGKANCHNCADRKYRILSDETIYRHLDKKASESDVVGVYPILEDNTVFFLCADFDDKTCQHGFMSDVLSYVNVCDEWNIPSYIERSRSGNGAHVWVFFSEAVPASKARRLGFAILKEATNRDGRIELNSYDRFFPNQDTLPKGGFGNLVALPLQGKARQNGNSVFVDREFKVIPDQWDYLGNARRIDPDSIDAVLSGHSYSLELSTITDDKPWETPKPKSISFEDFDHEVELVKANRLYIPISGVSAKALNHIKRVAAFHNPKYYELLNSRLPVYQTPSIISKSQMTDKYLSVPRGCEDEIIELLQGNLVPWKISDRTNHGNHINVTFNGVLRPEQDAAVKAMIQHDDGILHATTAFGKTVAAAALIASRGVNTLVIVPTRALLNQWKAQMEKFLIFSGDMPEGRTKRGKPRKGFSPVGLIGGAKDTRHGVIDVAVLQSCISDNEVKSFVRDYGMVIVDECHHIPAVNFERVLDYTDAKYIYGLTATPHREDKLDPIMYMLCGKIRFRSDAKAQMARQSFGRVLVPRFTAFRAVSEKTNASMYNAELANDRARNDMIVADVIAALKDGRSPLILTKLREHIDTLKDMLEPHCSNIICLTGTAPAKEKRLAMERLEIIGPNEPLVVIATGRYVGEGFDCPRLDTLFIALPVSYSNIVQQYTGRLHRDYDGKEEVRVYDYIDVHVPVLARMYSRRLKSYAPIGYTQQTTEALEPNPQDIIFDGNTFLPVLLQDISAARSTVIVSCKSLKYAKKAICETLATASARGVSCQIIVKESSDRDQSFVDNGIKVVCMESQTILAAIVDRSILWYGSVNFTGINKPDDNVMRMDMPEAASEMIGCLLD